MSLRAECRKTLLDVLKKEGLPPIIDKTYGSVWETFAKSQPSVLSGAASSTGQLVDTDVWGNLTRSLEKYGVAPNVAKKVVNLMKKKFGESPSQAEIKAFMV